MNSTYYREVQGGVSGLQAYVPRHIPTPENDELKKAIAKKFNLETIGTHEGIAIKKQYGNNVSFKKNNRGQWLVDEFYFTH